MATKFLTSTTRPGDSNLHYYYLPKGLIHMTVFRGGNDMNPEYRVEVSDEVKVVPDPAHRYFFKYQSNPYSSDNIAIEFSPEGFLKSINTTVKDETIEIINSILEATKELAEASTGFRSRDIEVQIFEKYFDPFDTAVMAEISGLLDSINYSFEVKPIGAEPAPVQSTSNDNRVGFYCRPTATYEMILTKWGLAATKGADRPLESLQSYLVSLPHPSVVHFVEIPVAPWVENTFSAEFSETGYPLRINFNKPSSALAAAKVPLNILKAILELPAMLFKFRVDFMNNKQESWRANDEFQEALEQRNKNQAEKKLVKRNEVEKSVLDQRSAEFDQKIKAMEAENQLLRKRISAASGSGNAGGGGSVNVATPPPPKVNHGGSTSNSGHAPQSDHDPI